MRDEMNLITARVIHLERLLEFLQVRLVTEDEA